MWGLVCGLVLGIAGRALLIAKPGWSDAANWLAVQVLDPCGQIFLRLLFFVVIPLVFASIALGIVQLGRLDRLGPLAARTFMLFAVNMAIAVALGLLMMNLVQPGASIEEHTRAQLLQEFQASAKTLQARAAEQPSLSFAGLVEMFLPRNLAQAVVEFQILPLIAFALLLGAAGTQLRDDQRQRLMAGLEIINDLMTHIVQFALRLAPYAVTALLASVVLKLGMQFLQALLLFVVGVLVVMAIHLFGTMSLMLKLLSRRSPLAFFRAIRTVMVTAFSTSSSGATLPTSIQVARENLGVSASTAGFVLPLGATMNMSGTALYEGCVVLFVAQVYGIELTLGAQITLLVLAVLSAVAVAAVPGASLPLIVGLLANFGLPPDGIALILGVDRLLDMARTVLNVSADVVTACIVDEHVNGAVPGLGAPPGT
jgi:DAACS family dicarboxylate/amino acid:cation (Na+ or H+) symporter